ncbi:hypothetical protein [Actinophytocola sediminis]
MTYVTGLYVYRVFEAKNGNLLREFMLEGSADRTGPRCRAGWLETSFPLDRIIRQVVDSNQLAEAAFPDLSGRRPRPG